MFGPRSEENNDSGELEAVKISTIEMQNELVRTGKMEQRRGCRGRDRCRTAGRVVGSQSYASCDRRPWWRVDQLISGAVGLVPAPRSPAPVLMSLCLQAEPETSASWFVGRVPLGKRILDLTLIFLCLPVLVPLFLLICLFIQIVSPGPVLFTQQRVGYRDKKFRMLKFRSMKVNAETSIHESHTTQLFKSNQPMEKMDHVDPRLIPLAWIVRSTGLDELPQLVNVLRGEMSLVGPRPCTIYEHEVLLPWHKRRFEVLPGITGLWQVNGKNKTTFQQMINYDIAYARSSSVGLDLKILFKTAPVLLGQLSQMIQKKRRRGAPNTAAEPTPA